MGYMALTTHSHGSNDSTGYKSWLEQHPATQQNKSSNRHDCESRLVFNTPTISSWPGLQDASNFHSDDFHIGQCSSKRAFLASIFLRTCSSSKIRRLSIQLFRPLMAINLQPHTHSTITTSCSTVLLVCPEVVIRPCT